MAVRCDARDARKGGRETSRRRALSRKGFPRTHRVQPDGGALVIDARDGARAPFAPSASGVVLALAEHLHGQARPVHQRAAPQPETSDSTGTCASATRTAS